jgi:hypothetical protein
MLTIVLLSFWLHPANVAPDRAERPQQAKARPHGRPDQGPAPQATRCADLFETADERVKPALRVAPGAPPLLSFRHFEGRMHQRFSGVDLMLDDAGH